MKAAAARAAAAPPWVAGWRRGDLAATALAAALLLAWDLSGLDLPLARAWGGAAGFPWRDHWLPARLLHHGGRLLAGAVLASLAVNVWRPWTPGLGRARRVRWLAVTLAVLLVVPSIKQLSATSCPWSLAEFGGSAHWLSHWRWGVADGGPGHCFPSGHATSAAAFVGGWFALRGAYPRAASAWLAAVLALTALYGGGQLARGAHFASHTGWSLWLCWTLSLALLGGRAGPAARRDGPAATADP